MIPERCAQIRGANASASFENRHDPICKRIEDQQQRPRHNIEPVGGTAINLPFNGISHLLRCPGNDGVPTRTGELTEQVTHRQVVALHRSHNQLSAAVPETLVRTDTRNGDWAAVENSKRQSITREREPITCVLFCEF